MIALLRAQSQDFRNIVLLFGLARQQNDKSREAARKFFKKSEGECPARVLYATCPAWRMAE